MISKKNTIYLLIIPILLLVFSGCSLRPVNNDQTDNNSDQNEEQQVATGSEKEDVNSEVAISNGENINSEMATTSEEIDTSDWETYRNEEYGFEFQYSKKMVLKEKDNVSQQWIFLLQIGTDKDSNILDIGIMNYPTFQSFRNDLTIYFEDKDGEMKDVFIGQGDYEAKNYSIKYYSVDGDVDNIDYYIEKDNQLFRIRYNKIKNDLLSLNDFQFILDSFRFID